LGKASPEHTPGLLFIPYEFPAFLGVSNAGINAGVAGDSKSTPTLDTVDKCQSGTVSRDAVLLSRYETENKKGKGEFPTNTTITIKPPPRIFTVVRHSTYK